MEHKSSKKVLLAGGAGYIGAHVALVFLADGYDVVVVDNLCNSSAESLVRVKQLSNREAVFVQADIRDSDALDQLFTDHPDIDLVVHFAGLKAVGESVAKPMEYYDCNVNGTVSLIAAMERAGVTNMLFSSSATVYGEPERMPIDEECRLSATNPYGRTKLMVEEMLADLSASNPIWRTLSLRYFNPVGAHESGRIGEDPSGIPNNLFPFIAQVAVGRREKLKVFGDDYPTADGTARRDYIHVMDLAEGHLAAANFMLAADESADIPRAVNLGTGNSFSVLDCVQAWGRAVGTDITYEIAERRPGDVAESYAKPDLAAELLGWQALRDLDQMCRDHWNWQQQNPNGYE